MVADMQLGKESTAREVLEHFDTDLRGRTAVVTGGSTGLGLETCKALASRGCRVVLCALEQGQGEEAARRNIIGEDGIVGYDAITTPDIVVREVNLADFASIENFATSVLEEEERVDLLVLNAGVCGAQGETKQGLEMQMGVNHVGHALLCRRLLPRMRKTENHVTTRVIAVSSMGHRFGIVDPRDLQCTYTKFFGWGSYLHSKLANVLFIKALHANLKAAGASNVVACSLSPGIVATGIWAATPSLLRPALPFLCDRDVSRGAATTVWCCVSPTCGEFDTAGGAYCANCAISEPSAAARDASLQGALWEATTRCIEEVLQSVGCPALPPLA